MDFTEFNFLNFFSKLSELCFEWDLRERTQQTEFAISILCSLNKLREYDLVVSERDLNMDLSSFPSIGISVDE